MSDAQDIRDRYWMHRALVLARKGVGLTQPNPLVGALVLDAQGKPAGRGYHQRVGEAHAEVLALDEAAKRAKGGTLYVTLEPCAHTGRTAPCVDRILASGITRVVAPLVDPNPLVNGFGFDKLRTSGIDVSIGCREDQARRMNLPFFTWVEKKRPFVAAKAALTLDAKIGVTGRWFRISDPACDRNTMRLRAHAGAILIGVETLLTDNAKLTVRGKYAGRKPIRAIVDGRLRTPRFSRIFSEPGGPIWLFCRDDIQSTPDGRRRMKELSNQGAVLIPMSASPAGYFSEAAMLSKFAEAGVTSVLLEGGSRLFTRFAQADLIDRWIFYVAPQVLGDRHDGRETVPLLEVEDYHLQYHSVIRRGRDLEVVASKKG